MRFKPVIGFNSQRKTFMNPRFTVYIHTIKSGSTYLTIVNQQTGHFGAFDFIVNKSASDFGYLTFLISNN